jgi:hypothetical protein
MEEDRPAPSDDLGSTKISAWQLLGSMTRISCFLVVFSIVHYGMVPLVTVPMLSSTPNDPALAFPITLDGVRCSAADHPAFCSVDIVAFGYYWRGVSCFHTFLYDQLSARC